MNTLEEEKYIREERQRKQDLYRLMLDQQVSYNRSKREKQKNIPYRNNSFESDPLSIQNNTPKNLQYHQRYFPTIREDRKTQQVNYRLRKGSDFHQTKDEDRTQIYLSNCEEIIKNLRELKRKKQQQETPSIASINSQPSWSESKDNKISIQNYPRVNYFSSQGTPYNKSLQSKSTSIYKHKDRLKTLEDSEQYDEKKNGSSKKQFLLRKKQISSGYGNNHQKDTFSENFQGKESNKIQPHPHFQSNHHQAATEQYQKISSNQSEKIHRKLHQPKFLKYETNSNESIEMNSKIKKQERIPKQKERQKEEQNKIQQKELSECLKELTKFLKKHNEGEVGVSNNDLNTFHPLKTHTQETSVQASINPEKEQNKEGKEKGENFDQLQSQAIKALKQLNKKSQEFINVASKVNKKQRQDSPIKQFEKNPQDKLRLSNQLYKTNRSNDVQQKPLSLKSFKKGLSIQKQYSIRSTDNQQLVDIPEKEENKSQELLSLLTNHLQRQGDQNQELSFCLKELTEYLKDQNQEIEMMKNSRLNEEKKSIQFSKERQATSHNDLKQINEKEQDEDYHQSDQNRLNSAVLKNLKKVRMKGSLFKDKIESFRKQHHKLDILTQKIKKNDIEFHKKNETQNVEKEDRNEKKLENFQLSQEGIPDQTQKM